jgi:hypothetical protein
MIIKKSKRKPGIYSQWFAVEGLNEKGQQTTFLIGYNQAKTYKKAVEFWNKNWGNKCKAFVLRNCEPINDCIKYAC